MDEKQKALEQIYKTLVEYQITLGEVEDYYITKVEEKEKDRQVDIAGQL